MPLPAEHVMSGLLDGDSLTAVVAEARGARVATWRHRALHATTLPMADNVVMTYRGRPSPIRRRDRAAGAEAGTTRAGTVTVIPAGSSFRWDIDGAIEAVHVYVHDASLRAWTEETTGSRHAPLTALLTRPDPLASQLVVGIEDAAHDPLGEQALLLEHLLDSLLLRTLVLASRRPPTTRPARLSSRKVDTLRRLIMDDPRQRPTVEGLARRLGVSRWELTEGLRAATGTSVRQFVLAVRVEMAVELLAHASLPLAEVADSCGFADQAHMTRCVRLVSGRTPLAIRRAGRSGG